MFRVPRITAKNKCQMQKAQGPNGPPSKRYKGPEKGIKGWPCDNERGKGREKEHRR